MIQRGQLPVGVSLSSDIEYREGRPNPHRARVRWIDPVTLRRKSLSESMETADTAEAWIDLMRSAASAGADLEMAVKTLAEYGDVIMPVAVRGLERKTLDPYMAGWHKRVVPTLGHLAVRMITYGAVDRAVHAWIADGCSRSTI
jgi:hypothetical protein